MKKNTKIDEFIEKILEHLKGFALAAFVTVAILSALVGYRYYRYTQDDPQFCASCHLMKEAYNEWQRGKHRDVLCQQCHQLSILEKNRLLVAYVVKGNQPLAQTHGREKPWKACRGCHLEDIVQGSVTTNRSYGHARHVFMQGVHCKSCHKGTIHNFRANEKTCQDCHKDKAVHGTGMEAFPCLKCHSFTEKSPSMIPKDRCIKCHTNIATIGPMSGLLCYQCHKPHGKIHPSAASCMSECHRNITSAGKHKTHLLRGLDCISCHRPHTWTVGRNSAKTLCGKCHRPKDPSQFMN
ncbi:MAG: NapC/NirT family cytochrome c [Dissulfurispiraceae bacterium]|jgi:nitrate/TMAO reductase-like tetraheme cytochrome c subunit